jgi:hypothetical protein
LVRTTFSNRCPTNALAIFSPSRGCYTGHPCRLNGDGGK